MTQQRHNPCPPTLSLLPPSLSLLPAPSTGAAVMTRRIAICDWWPKIMQIAMTFAPLWQQQVCRIAKLWKIGNWNWTHSGTNDVICHHWERLMKTCVGHKTIIMIYIPTSSSIWLQIERDQFALAVRKCMCVCVPSILITTLMTTLAGEDRHE